MQFEQLSFYLPTLLLLPLIGAAIGWATNYIAIKMLFRPRKPVRLFLFTVQGVFPKRQKALAKKVGEIVSTELFSVHDVLDRLERNLSSDEILELIGDKIEKVIVEKLSSIIPMVTMVLTPEILSLVRGLFVSELDTFLHDIIDSLEPKLQAELDIHKIVEEKVANFSDQKLEQLLFQIMKREFKFIEFVGAILGFLIGLVQVGIVLLDSGLLI